MIDYAQDSRGDILFLFLFLFRYLRFFVHTITGLFLYKPALEKTTPKYTSRDVAVIVPTVGPNTPQFRKTCETILQNKPRVLMVVTVGKLVNDVKKLFVGEGWAGKYPATDLVALESCVANKRKQIAIAADRIELDYKDACPITVNIDDTVNWGPNFLPSILAAFEDPKVGFVGMNKKVERVHGRSFIENYTNFIACLYLERHNFQIASEPYIDGGVFVVSGRTAALRSEILNDPRFRKGYENERYLFGLLGPLNADDDNYVTRFVLRDGWKIKIQYCADSTIRMPLGGYPKFYQQIQRWARTTFRSNMASLRDPHTWVNFPWSVYAVYISGMVNFALFWDPLLLWKLRQTSFYLTSDHPALITMTMCAWILGTKMVKIWPHFQAHPEDWVFLPGYFFFAYAHSLVKLWCLVTFFDHSWSGRNLKAVEELAVRQEKFNPRQYLMRGITGLVRMNSYTRTSKKD